METHMIFETHAHYDDEAFEQDREALLNSMEAHGIGHIVNLLNGKDLIPTLLQVCYAIAIGFLFTIIFYKGKSLLPCIIAHSFVNSSSVFAVENSSMKFHIISSAVLCIISLSCPYIRHHKILYYCIPLLQHDQGISYQIQQLFHIHPHSHTQYHNVLFPRCQHT